MCNQTGGHAHWGRSRRNQDRGARRSGPRARSLLRRRVPTPVGDYDATVAHGARPGAGPRGGAGARPASVGIGMPGTLSPATGLSRTPIRPASSAGPFDRDLAAALARGRCALPTTPIASRSRRQAMARPRARASCSASSSAPASAAASSSTGGSWSAPTPSPGNGAIRPCPGPATTSARGRACYCGKHGCIETFLSGPALARDGGAADAATLAARADAGDPAAAARARPLRGPAGAQPRHGHQPHRPRHHRAGRRRRPHPAPL